MRIILSGGWSYGNIGDEAIARTSYELTKLTWPNADIYVLSNNPSDFQTNHNIEALQSPHSVLGNCTLADFNSIINDPDGWGLKEFIQLFNCDDLMLYIMCGGGYLHQGWTSQFVSKMVEISIANLYGAKIAIVGQSIGPFTDSVYRECLTNQLNMCNYISVRDSDSYNFLKTLHLDVEVNLGADTANVIDEFIVPSADKKENDINVMVSGYTNYCSIDSELDHSQSVISKMLGRLSLYRLNYYRSLSVIIKCLTEEYGCHINFIMSTSWDWDYRTVKRITKGSNTESYTIFRNLSIDDMCSKLSESHIILSTKMHPLIISNAYGAETFAISYNYKVTNYMDSIGRGPYCYINNDLNAKSIISDIVKSLYNVDKRKQYGKDLKISVHEMFDDLKRLCGETNE